MPLFSFAGEYRTENLSVWRAEVLADKHDKYIKQKTKLKLG